MNKKKFNIKTEIFNYIGMIAVLVLFGFVTYDSGAFQDMRDGNYQKIGIDYSTYELSKYFRGSPRISKNIKIKPIQQEYYRYKIPGNVLTVLNSSNSWDNLFKNNQAKVVFYINDNENFDNSIKNYIFSNFPYLYTVKSYSTGDYLSMNSNITIQSDICKSLADCNEMRKRAELHSGMTTFLDRCTKNVCIFNNRKNEYIMIYSKNVSEVINALNQNKNW